MRPEHGISLSEVGYGIGLTAGLTMLVDGLTAHIRGDGRADDIVAYTVLAGIPAAAALVTRRWLPPVVLLALLVAAAASALAGVRGLTQFWVYASLFVVSAVLGSGFIDDKNEKPPATTHRLD